MSCMGQTYLFKDNWEHRTSPILFTIVYLVSLAMCLAVGAMFIWQVWSVAIGETAVESYDYQYYRKVATSRGEVCHGKLLHSKLV